MLAINAAKSVNGWLGILSAICFIIAGLNAKNYLSIGEQLAYVITLDVPVLLSANWNVNMASRSATSPRKAGSLPSPQPSWSTWYLAT